MNSLHSIPGFDKALKLGLIFLKLNIVFKLIIAFVIIYGVPVLLLRLIFRKIGRVALIIDLFIQLTFLIAVFIIARSQSQAALPEKTIIQPTLLCLMIFLTFSILPRRLFPKRSTWVRHGALIVEMTILVALLFSIHTQTQTGHYWIHVLMGL